MTNHYGDLRNADVFMICGANPGGNRPVSWKWIEWARDGHDAKIIVVDPRFTRSAARADLFSFIRPGTDIAFCGAYAKKEGLDKAYGLHPKAKKGKDYTHIALFEYMYAGKMKGLIAWGQNPGVSGPNANLECAAMDKLEWFVAADLWDTDTMNFWQRPGADPKSIQTEAWALPAATSVEKSGAVSNSGRLAQYRWKAVEPPGDAMPDGWMIRRILKAVKELHRSEGGKGKECIGNLFWAYDEDEHGEPDLDQVMVEINGFTWPEGEFSWETAFKNPVFGFWNLEDDGSTVSGAWVYCGQWASDADVEGAAKILGIDGQLPKGDDGKVKIPRNKQDKEWNGIPFNKGQWRFNKAPVYWLGKDGVTIYTENAPSDAKRIDVGTYPLWAWAWPLNRRIIYNRCSCDRSGKPFAPGKALFTFENDETPGMKNDAHDFYAQASSDPAFPAELKGKASMRTRSGAFPYSLNREPGALVARPFSSSLAEGPFPEHYEPRESPVKNALSGARNNPVIVLEWPSAKEEPEKWGFAEVGDPKYPYVCATYRVTEHWQAGQMTRNNSWLGGAVPGQFVEISVELADELGIKKGDLVEVESRRGKVQGVAAVTSRPKPLEIGDNGGTRKIHVVGLTWRYGYVGLFPGGMEGGGGISRKNYSANQLTPHVGDPNATIPEYKAFLVNLRKVK